jgi:hypothetical protein
MDNSSPADNLPHNYRHEQYGDSPYWVPPQVSFGWLPTSDNSETSHQVLSAFQNTAVQE